MNVVPVEFVRVMPEDMRAFVFDMYRRVEMSRDRARLMAELLVGTDIRGVFSHGTRQSARYLRLLRDGDLNPNPDATILHQTATTGTIDGDGGLGHFASWRAAHLAVEKAEGFGHGSGGDPQSSPFWRGRQIFQGDIRRRHGGIRRIVARPATVARAGDHVSERRVADEFRRTGGPGASAGSGYVNRCRVWPETPISEKIFHRMPSAFFKSLGLGAVCHALGGLLAGIQTAWMRRSRNGRR